MKTTSSPKFEQTVVGAVPEPGMGPAVARPCTALVRTVAVMLTFQEQGFLDEL